MALSQLTLIDFVLRPESARMTVNIAEVRMKMDKRGMKQFEKVKKSSGYGQIGEGVED